MFMKKIPALAMYDKLLQILLTCQTTVAVYLNIVRQKSTFNKAGAFVLFIPSWVHQSCFIEKQLNLV